MYLIATILVMTCNLLIGALAYMNNRKSATHRLFLLLTIILSFWAITNYLSLNGITPQESLFWIRIVMAVAVSMFPVIFLLTYTFPQKYMQISPFYLYGIVFFTLSAQFLALTPLVFSGITVSNNNITPVPGPGMYYYAANVLGFSLLSIITLFRKNRQLKGLEKIQLKYLILGIAFTFTSGTITNFLFVNIFKITSFVALGPFFTFLLVAFIFYAIARHRFLDINLIVARTISYILLIGFFGLLYALFFGVLSSFFISATLEVRTVVVSTFLALIMAFSFQTVRRVLEKLTDRIFYKNHYDRDKLLYDLTLIMASTLQLEELSHQLLKEFLAQMRISRGAFILINKDRIYDVAHEGFKEFPELNEDRIVSLANQNQTLIFEELGEGQNKQTMRDFNFSVSISLHTAGDQIGLLVLGEKLSGDIYTSEDIGVMEILVPEAAVAIKNSLAYEEIQRFNITLKEEIKQAITKLERANIKLRELDKLKDEFVSLASHELRTPMTAIKSYLWLALNKSLQPLSPETKKNLVISYQETERLLKMVQNMLTISRIEGKRLELNIEPLDITDLVKRVFDELKIKADEKNMKYTFAGYPEKLIIHGDSDNLIEVFQNIIGNALKYTPAGGSVSLSFSREQDKAVVFISDSGPGISKDDLGKLFKKFGRLKEAKQNRSPGTGLGLYITKNIVELHKGEIKIHSVVGKGTTFIIILPLVQSQNIPV